MVLLDRELSGDPEPPLANPCAGCPAPCAAACPAGAVAAAGFALDRCVQHRLAEPACAHDCCARRACIVGIGHAYGASQLGFHMAASLHMIRPR